MSSYCDPSDLYRYGLPRGNLPNPGRLVASVNTSTDVLTLDGHGFAADDVLLFRAEEGGALPSGLVEGTTYYAIPLTESTFKVSASEGGSDVNLTTEGESIVVVTPISLPDIIEAVSELVESWLPAHMVPLEAPIPPQVRMVVAQLSAQMAMQGAGANSASFSALVSEAQKQIARWQKGLPIRGAARPAEANLSVVASAATSSPWVPSGGTLP